MESKSMSTFRNLLFTVFSLLLTPILAQNPSNDPIAVQHTVSANCSLNPPNPSNYYQINTTIENGCPSYDDDETSDLRLTLVCGDRLVDNYTYPAVLQSYTKALVDGKYDGKFKFQDPFIEVVKNYGTEYTAACDAIDSKYDDGAPHYSPADAKVIWVQLIPIPGVPNPLTVEEAIEISQFLDDIPGAYDAPLECSATAWRADAVYLAGGGRHWIADGCINLGPGCDLKTQRPPCPRTE